MSMGKYLLKSLLPFLLFVGLLFQGCASSGGASGSSGNAKVYHQDYNEMIEVVERAIKGSNINIAHFDDSKEGVLRMIINREVYINNESTQSEQGRVVITQLDGRKTQVEVENPEYHFSVPDHQKINYQRIIFNRINSLLD